jgi:polynucleotide 5'-kinase involved in rRNA processing
VESLRLAIVKRPRNKAKAPYNILLVGEAGVGKSSFVEFLANALAGNDIDHYHFGILDDQGGSDNQGQTKSAHVYEISNNNGIVVSQRF